MGLAFKGLKKFFLLKTTTQTNLLDWLGSWATLVAWMHGFVSDGIIIAWVEWVTWVYKVSVWVYKFLTWVGVDPKFKVIPKFYIGRNVQAET